MTTNHASPSPPMTSGPLTTRNNNEMTTLDIKSQYMHTARDDDFVVLGGGSDGARHGQERYRAGNDSRGGLDGNKK